MPPIRITGARIAGSAIRVWRRNEARVTSTVSTGRPSRRAIQATCAISTAAMTSAGMMPASISRTAEISTVVA